MLIFCQRTGDFALDRAAAPWALRLGHPTPQMSPGWRCARASSFILLREVP
ncbi:hypothetical protein [Variovorax sp. PCZ-1]|uniref:hypothetical protein n=1 Tax=Variovorax sp. PCZ-1 TaxID=2835533 RepID=UPI001BCD68A1|nr:hypothetical protein [Variovorax sp. PCZ-1]MBS7808976.1 hypothetical protein [Variovorax sp. PCZ-1]